MTLNGALSTVTARDGKSITGVSITVSPVSGDPTLDEIDFYVGPTNNVDGQPNGFDQRWNPIGASELALAAGACRNQPLLQTAAQAAGAVGTDPIEGQYDLNHSTVHPFTGCLAFKYTGQPTTVIFAEVSPNQPTATWSLPPTPAASAPSPTALASFSGPAGNFIKAIPTAAQAGKRLCYRMGGNGRHILATGDDPNLSDHSGPDPAYYNGVQIEGTQGVPANTCITDADSGWTPLGKYFAIGSDGAWSVTVYSF